MGELAQISLITPTFTFLPLLPPPHNSSVECNSLSTSRPEWTHNLPQNLSPCSQVAVDKSKQRGLWEMRQPWPIVRRHLLSNGTIQNAGGWDECFHPCREWMFWINHPMKWFLLGQEMEVGNALIWRREKSGAYDQLSLHLRYGEGSRVPFNTSTQGQ